MMLYTETRLVRHARNQATNAAGGAKLPAVHHIGGQHVMVSWFRRLAMSQVDEIDQELRKLAKALKRERLKGKAYGSVDAGRWLLLLEDADDLLDRRLSATKGV